MPARHLLRRATVLGTARADQAPIYVDSDDNIVKVIPAGTGTTEVQLVDASSVQTLTNKTLTAPAIVQPFNTYSVDGAVTVVPQVAYLTKTSAGAYTIAAPGAAGIGVVITFSTGTDFAHVVTFTGTTLQDGTVGANSTWTAAAVQGSSLTVVGATATKWNVVNFNLGTIAP